MSDLPKAPFANCEACPLKHSYFVPSDLVRPAAKYSIVGESPGRDEITLGRSFVGYSGKLLWAVLSKCGVSREDCNVTNAVLCAPPANYEVKQEVLSAAAACCRQRLDNELEQFGDLPAIALGRTAREHFFGPERDGESITTLHGRWMGNVLSTYHPAFILRSPEDAKTMFDDIQKFVLGPEGPMPMPTYEVVTSENFASVLDKLSYSSRIAFDIETDQIDFLFDDILLLVLADSPGHAYIFPGRHPEAPEDLIYTHKAHPSWNLFWSGVAEFVGHNAKFDIRFLKWNLGWSPRVDFDTMIAHYAMDERKGTHDLKGLAARNLNVEDYEISLKQYLRSRNDKYGKIPWKVLCQYAAWDACCTWRLAERFSLQLQDQDLYEWPFRKLLMPLNDLLIHAELVGMHVDTERALKAQEDFGNELDTICKELERLSQGVIQNPNSARQVAQFLYYDDKGPRLPPPRGKKIKEGSTNKEALAHLKGQHPTVDLVTRHRRIAKMKSSYIDNLLDMVDDNNDVHCDFQIHGAETGRLSVRKPALQTIPRADEKEAGRFGQLVKDCYAAREGKLLVAGDYNQCELRIAAALSGEPFLLEVYAQDRDLHTEVAKSMYGPEYTKTQRVLCKMFNFSYLYGGSEFSFAQDSGLPINKAREFVKMYDALMPVLVRWKLSMSDEMKAQGYVQYRTGRRRRIPFISFTNKDDARKASFNSPAQGQASDMTSLAAVEFQNIVDQRGVSADVLLMVHDSIIVEAQTEDVPLVAELLEKTMTRVASTWFPEVMWKAEVETGYRWGTMKELVNVINRE